MVEWSRDKKSKFAHFEPGLFQVKVSGHPTSSHILPHHPTSSPIIPLCPTTITISHQLANLIKSHRFFDGIFQLLCKLMGRRPPPYADRYNGDGEIQRPLLRVTRITRSLDHQFVRKPSRCVVVMLNNHPFTWERWESSLIYQKHND